MQVSRRVAAFGILLMITLVVPAFCLVAATPAAAMPSSGCHHHGSAPTPAHTCCRTAPAQNAATVATFTPPTMAQSSDAVADRQPDVSDPAGPIILDAHEFPSPPPLILRI